MKKPNPFATITINVFYISDEDNVYISLFKKLRIIIIIYLCWCAPVCTF